MHYAVSRILHNAHLRLTLTITLTPTIALILPLLTVTLKSMYTACQLPTCPEHYNTLLVYLCYFRLFTLYKAMVSKFMVSQACPPQIWHKLFHSLRSKVTIVHVQMANTPESFCLSSILVICIYLYTCISEGSYMYQVC